jgi:hypothetical protein
MQVSFTWNRLLVLVAVIMLAVIGIVDIADRAFDHEFGWTVVALAVFAASFLL